MKNSYVAAKKFIRIFRRTAHYLRRAVVIERAEGQLSRSNVDKLISSWAKEILDIIAIQIEIKGEAPDSSVPHMFVGNHVSYVDIPLLMATVPVVFVAKSEVAKWMIIGPAAKKAGTVFVRRDSGPSRAMALESIAACINDHQRSVAVFPSGTTTTDEQKPWRQGAFAVAAKHAVKVQPFRITYHPLRQLAYIDLDFFPFHLWNLLLSKHTTKAILEFGKPEMLSAPVSDCKRLQEWSQQIHKHQSTLENSSQSFGQFSEMASGIAPESISVANSITNPEKFSAGERSAPRLFQEARPNT
ncbi:MAG: lysophospholipid acyltransferase family protein [Proteobacteria bacterium]|nr:lysophospholipid acyltransferase family protein [Pseudomonadota bacterium]